MNNIEAQQILAACRPNGRDAEDPFFQDALQQAAQEPVLSRHFAEQQAFDARAAAALRRVPVPVEAQKLISAEKISSPAAMPPRRHWILPPAGVAAGLAILFGIVAVIKSAPHEPAPVVAEKAAPVAPVNFAAFADFLGEHKMTLAFTGNDYLRVREWLELRGDPVPVNLPPGFASLASVGCQAWATPLGKVSLVCFTGPDRKTLHLYVFDNPAALGALPDRAAPAYDRLDKWAVAAWRDQQHAYVLGVTDEREPRTALSGLLGS